jgi:hypothetical protein
MLSGGILVICSRPISRWQWVVAINVWAFAYALLPNLRQRPCSTELKRTKGPGKGHMRLSIHRQNRVKEGMKEKKDYARGSRWPDAVKRHRTECRKKAKAKRNVQIFMIRQVDSKTSKGFCSS